MSLLSLLADVLYVGHSLIGPNLPPLVEGALELLRGPSVVQAQIINGASLAYNWDHSEDAKGVDARAALTEGLTRALVLTESQPIADQMSAGTTIPALTNFARAARDANPDAKLFLYESWPAMTGDAARWRDRIAADLPLWQLAAASAGAEVGAEITLIPAGQAMALLSLDIEAGAVPGVTSIRDFFSDEIHLSGKGLYFTALAMPPQSPGEAPRACPPK